MLCTQELLKKIDFMLRVLTTEKNQSIIDKQEKERDTQNLLEVTDIFITLLVRIVSQYMHVSTLIKKCTLNIFNFLHIKCTSIKLKKRDLFVGERSLPLL